MGVNDWLKMPIQNQMMSWEDVRHIPIDRKNPLHQELLVEIEPSVRLKVYSAYYHEGIAGSLQAVYTRQSILRKLHELLSMLPDHLGILVLDAWRPIVVQEALRHNFRETLLLEYPDFNAIQIDDVLNQFVAKPSQNPIAPSPHLTGGSIDLTLFDVVTNSELDMGTSFDAMDEASWSHYFEDNTEHFLGQDIRDNRRILINGMKSIGFSNLPSEWWHFDYGNQLWGYYTEEDAFYGIAQLSERSSR